MNFAAHTELHEALTNLAMAESFASERNFLDALDALFDAERHGKAAVLYLTSKDDRTAAGKLTGLNARISALRSTIRIGLAKQELHRAAGA